MSEERPITVKEDIQEHYIIYDREIKPNPQSELGKNILVTNDDLSNRLYFNMFYTFDDRELENKEISIVWINANDEKGFSVATDKTLEGDRLSFAWNVPVQATYKEGIIYFAVRIVSDNYIWNSLAGKVEVKKGLVTESFNSLEEAELSPGWVDYIEGKYQLSLVKISETDYTALSPKDINTIYVVEMNDGSVNQYLGDKQIAGGGNIEGDYLTVGFSDSYNTSSYQYGFLNRDESLYTIFQHNTDDTLTVLKDNISATELEQYTFSDDLTYYIFDKTPIPFKTGYVTSLQWVASYTINSCTVQTIQNYIYSYDNISFDANSITLDTIKSPSDGINIGSGNINGMMVSSTGEIVIGDSPLKEYDYKYVFIGCSVKRTTTSGSYTVGRANLTRYPNVNGPNVMYYQRGSSLYYAGEPYKLPIDDDSMSYTSDGKLQADITKYLPVNTILAAPPNYVTGVNNVINILANIQFTYVAKGFTGITSTSTAQQTTVTGLKSGDYYIGYAPNAVANKKIRYNITDLYIGIDTPKTPTDDSVIFWYNPSKITNTLISKDSSEVFQGILLAKYTYNADTDKISNCTPLGKRDIDGSFLTEYINNKKSDNNTVEYPGITAVPENNIWLSSITYENSTTYTIHAGLSVKLPYGKNADGTNKFIDSTFTEDTVIDFNGPYGKRYIVALPGQSSMATINEIVISTEKPVSNDLTSPSANYIYWYNPLTNNSYLITFGSTEEITPTPAIIIGWLSSTPDSTGTSYYIRDIHQLNTFSSFPMATSLAAEIDNNNMLMNTPSDVLKVTEGETTKYYVGGLNNYVLNTDESSQNFVTGNENVVIGRNNKIQINNGCRTNNFIVGYTNNIINNSTTTNSINDNVIFGGEHNVTDSFMNMLQGNRNTLINSNKSLVTGAENSGTNVYESFINGLSNNVQNLHSTIISGNGVKTVEISGTSNHLSNSIVVGNTHEISGRNESMAVFGQYNKALGESTYASFIAGQGNTDYGSRSTITGYDNTNLSTGDFPVQMFGQSGVNRGHNSVYFGFKNIETETASSSVGNMYIGSNNTNTGTSNHSLIGGQTNTIESVSQSIIHGGNNTVSATTSSSIITGSNNQTSNVYNSLVFGDNNHINNISGALINGTANIVNDFNYGMVIGRDLVIPDSANDTVRMILGQYNIPDTENKYSLVIGNGTANDSRSNSLTLSTDGNLEVIGDIKLKTINSLSDTISQLLTKVNELTAQVSELTTRVEALETPTPTPTPTE